MRACVLALCLVSSLVISRVSGHGFLASPGARNSMWRLGYETPKNYNDMGLNCGGASNQWESNGGKCGLCGDPYEAPQPREHEAGGRYAPVNRPVSRCYNQDDDVIDVVVRITAHHKGYFEFRLCENNNMLQDPSASCIENGRLLKVAGTDDTRYDITSDVKEFYEFQLTLPDDVVCTQCILHWKYNAGNSYGCDETGCGMGLGAQEQFINCADIAILPDCETITTPKLTTKQTDGPVTTEEWVTSTEGGNDDPDGGVDQKCRAAGEWEGDAEMDAWCIKNCLYVDPYCPETHCTCDD